MASFQSLHPSGAKGDGVRRGNEPDPADRHRRDVGCAARGTGGAGAAGADRQDRGDEPHRPEQHRTRHQGAGVRRVLRPGAARKPAGGRSLFGMNDDPFVAHRSLLFTVAYEMTGSAADAEDVVQEAWLRWADVDQSEVRDPRAYLVRIVTRKALDRLRALSRRREEYVGEWLPEPLLTSPDVAEGVELAESVSIAMLTVLETLGPTERAVFVLREVFEVPYDEIAEAIGKPAATVRQIARRAREHVAARRPRAQVSRSEQQAVVERFLVALRTGQLQELMEIMAPDVVLIADGGGLVAAALAPIHGAEPVANLLAGVKDAVAVEATTIWLNGAPAGRIEFDGELSGTVSLVVENGRVTRIYVVRNPRKLARLDQPAALAR